jgi:hypothetical protein
VCVICCGDALILDVVQIVSSSSRVKTRFGRNFGEHDVNCLSKKIDSGKIGTLELRRRRYVDPRQAEMSKTTETRLEPMDFLRTFLTLV